MSSLSSAVMPNSIEPFVLYIPQQRLDDLKRRLTQTRWPVRDASDDWNHGAPLQKVRELCEYWRDDYDWRRCESALNGWGQYRTALLGLNIHFLHIRSPEPNALPMLITHGWPGSVIEFHKVIGPLTDPVAHGGDARDAFHLVLPSLPGYGFSEKPAAPGWGCERIAQAWAALMDRLGYSRYVVQGGDWGADVAAQLWTTRARGLLAIHLNSPFFDVKRETRGDERKAPDKEQFFQDPEHGYYKLQGTPPQAVGCGLADSPALQAAWIYEKLHAWSDNPGDVEQVLSMDEVLDNIMLYWLPNVGASSSRLHWEDGDHTELPIEPPVSVGRFARAPDCVTPSGTERYGADIIHWHELDRCGHFAAFEQPDLFIKEVRNCFQKMR